MVEEKTEKKSRNGRERAEETAEICDVVVVLLNLMQMCAYFGYTMYVGRKTLGSLSRMRCHNTYTRPGSVSRERLFFGTRSQLRAKAIPRESKDPFRCY